MSALTSTKPDEGRLSPMDEKTMDLEAQKPSSPSSGAGTPKEALHDQPSNVEKSSDPPPQAPQEMADWKTLIVVLPGVYLAIFLIALDRTILATAIPSITDEFNSFQDIGWYGSAYMLTFCAFQLTFGRVYTFYSSKRVFLSCVVLFEVGSAICGAAPNSIALILGRAVAGLGASGMMGGGIIIITELIPLHKRPIFQSGAAVLFGIASVIGPLMGGAFTAKISWRWCFYINLPIGAVTIFGIVLLFEPSKPKAPVPLRQQIQRLDPIGLLAFLPAIVCLLLALQWGGSTYKWSSGRIIALLVLTFVLIICFIGVQVWKQELATVPPRILKKRTIMAGFEFMLFFGGTLMLLVYYLPIYFQAIKDANAVHSGIMNLPLLLGLVVAAQISGFTVAKLGYYWPFIMTCTIITSIGTGLLTTFTPTTAHPTWIGYQVLTGFGMGMGMQQVNIAAQTKLERKDTPTGISLMFFAQSLGGAIFISVGENVLDNQLTKGLAGKIPGVDPTLVATVGATNLKSAIPAQYLDVVKDVYSAALSNVFDVATAVACCTFIGAAFIQWGSVKRKNA